MLKMYEVPSQISACYDHETESYDLEAIKTVTMETRDKAIAYVAVIKNLAGEAAAIDAEIKRLRERAATLDRNKQSLMKALLFGMQSLNVEEFSNGIHKVRITNNSRPSIDVINEDAVPAEFKREVREIKIDKDAIWEQVQETGEIPDGVEVRKGQHLRIS